MTSPFMTVAVLTVLWLIVAVPMILRRNDEQARQRSLDRFGRSMRALGRRSSAAVGSVRRSEDRDDATAVSTKVRGPRSEVFVSGLPVRRPVPAAQEALMYPVDRSEMSAARAAMMARRRRSLTVLVVGAIFTTIMALKWQGLVWLLSALFLAGLAGYLWFLRAQAQRDRDRRQNRRERTTSRRARSYDVTDVASPTAIEVDDTVVRIDDDDIELHSMDTIDLTGLYSDEGTAERVAERRAS